MRGLRDFFLGAAQPFAKAAGFFAFVSVIIGILWKLSWVKIDGYDCLFAVSLGLMILCIECGITLLHLRRYIGDLEGYFRLEMLRMQETITKNESIHYNQIASKLKKGRK